MPAEHRLEAAATPDALEQVHALLDQLFASIADLEDTDRFLFATAVAEVAANIVEHGGGTRFVLTLRGGERLDARFEDDGAAIDPDVLFRSLPADDAMRGRGMAIVRAAVDEVRYERDGDLNRWTLVRGLAK